MDRYDVSRQGDWRMWCQSRVVAFRPIFDISVVFRDQIEIRNSESIAAMLCITMAGSWAAWESSQKAIPKILKSVLWVYKCQLIWLPAAWATVRSIWIMIVLLHVETLLAILRKGKNESVRSFDLVGSTSVSVRRHIHAYVIIFEPDDVGRPIR
jgi:hypothetical protein